VLGAQISVIIPGKKKNKNQKGNANPPQNSNKGAKQRPVPPRVNAIASALNKTQNGAQVTTAEVDAAIKQFATQILDPTEGFYLPRPAGPLVHPTLYKRELVYTPKDGDSPLELVIKVSQDLDKAITVWSPGASLTVVGGATESLTPEIPAGVLVTGGSFYSFPFGFYDSSGGRLTTSVLSDFRGDYDFLVYGWNTEKSQFEKDKVHVGNWAMSNAVAHTYLVEMTSTTGIKNPDGGTLVNYGLTLSGPGEYTPGNYTRAINLTQGTTSYNDGAAMVSPFTVLYQTPNTVQLQQVIFNISNVDATYTGEVESTLPISGGKSFETIRSTSSKFCISAFSALLSYEGSSGASGGHVSACLLPAEEVMPHIASQAIARMSIFPKKRLYSGKAKQGAHVSWLPDVINQLWLRRQDDPVIPSQNIWIAMQIPAPGVQQIPQVRLYTHFNVEWENYQQEYNARACHNASMFLTAFVDLAGEFEAAGENPDHLKKIGRNIKRIMKDPTVQMFSRLAVQGAKIAAPAILGLL